MAIRIKDPYTMYPMIYRDQGSTPADHHRAHRHAILAIIITAISLPLGMLVINHTVPMHTTHTTP